MEIVYELMKVAPAVGIMAWWVYSLKEQLKDLKEDNKNFTEDYKKMAENAIKVVTIADDRLKNDQSNNEQIKDIHRMVGELLDIERRRKEA